MTEQPTAADRIAALGRPVTQQQRDAAAALLGDILATAEKHGIRPADLDWAADLPTLCVDVVQAKAPVMDRRSWYMPKESADALAAAVNELHHSTRRPKHAVMAAIVETALGHLDEVRQAIRPAR